MKGPGGRLRFDIRRVWECPVCHRRELTAGDVVTRLCTCSTKSDPPPQNWMRLIEEKPPRPAPPPPPLAQPVENSPTFTELAPASPPSATPTLPASDNPTPHGF